ncbi:MAG TPA: hypothetical protein VFR47_30295 [Anaerolineales bacterium]|nr:hypothetical protein [Anaerolineales bacterium]
MWTTLQIVFGILGILLAWGGDKLSLPILTYAGIACFGLAASALGWEAIFTQQIQLGSRRRGNRQTYTGIAAVLHGIQFNLIGLFLIGISLVIYLNEQDQISGRGIFLQFVRRPGIPLLVLGMLLLMQAVITLTGSHELRQGPRWVVIMNLLVSRFLPGVILVVLGLGAMWLGTVEIMAPEAFDERGGGFLEVLYGLR